jgi:hypothetical protein
LLPSSRTICRRFRSGLAGRIRRFKCGMGTRARRDEAGSLGLPDEQADRRMTTIGGSCLPQGRSSARSDSLVFQAFARIRRLGRFLLHDLTQRSLKSLVLPAIFPADDEGSIPFTRSKSF